MKKEKNLRRFVMNNKGLSLVEVMVAITLLTIVSVALLKSFSMAANINKKAKEKQNALTIAESIMEGFKAYDLQSINDQFGTGVSVDDFKLYNLDSGASKSLSGTNNFDLSNVTAGGKKYDAKIRVDGSSNAEHNKTMNKVDNLAGGVDAVFEQEPQEQIDLMRKIYTDLSAQSDFDSTAMPSHMFLDRSAIDVLSRVLTVTISDTEVNVTSTYTYNVTNMDYTKTDGSVGTFSQSGVIYTIDSTVTGALGNYSKYHITPGANIEDVYLFYYPAYSYAVSVPSLLPVANDSIDIENNSTGKNVYLVKQLDTVNFSSTTLRNLAEGSYSVTISKTTSNGVNLFHNFPTDGSVGGPSYSLNGFTTSEDKQALWDSSSTIPLVYNVTIEIYNAGESDCIFTLNGTVNAR